MRAQAAMEYLMTYGWALLIVVIVGVALWSLGVFNVGAGSTPKLTGISTLVLMDAGRNDSDSFKLVVGPTREIENVNIKYNGANCTVTDINGNDANALKPSQKYYVVCGGWDNSSTVEITLTYNIPNSDIQHHETGTVTGLSS